MTDGNASDQDDENLTDERLAELELLAELERRAENRNSSRSLNAQEEPCLNDPVFSTEHLRLYQFVNQLTSPVRIALRADEAPPILPEYDELEEISRGGMGIVYRSLHKRMQRVDAIKVIRPDRLTDISSDAVKQIQHRFERDLRLAAFVAHEHIVPVYQVGEIEGCSWFSIQFVKGSTLHSLSKSELPNSVVVWLLLHVHASEPWVWLAIFRGYVPLFGTFAASQQLNRSSESARRELWSIWSGHAVGSFACFISLRVLFYPDFVRVMEVFYPCWAVISSVAFFAKSGNFWPAYRWIGGAWSAIAVVLAFMPAVSPIAFGVFAALTCIITARGDREFWDG